MHLPADKVPKAYLEFMRFSQRLDRSLLGKIVVLGGNEQFL